MAGAESFSGTGLELPAKVEELVKELEQMQAVNLQDYTELVEGGSKVRAMVLRRLAQSSRLMRLCVADSKVRKAAEVEELCKGLCFNKVLLSLDVSYNWGVGSVAGCRHMGTMLQSNCSLKALYMQSVGMRPQGMKTIARSLRSNPGSCLELLHLCGNWKLGDKGAHHMARMLEAGSGLKKLDIRGTGVRAQGMAHIAGALGANGSSALESLFVDDMFGDEGAKHIADILRNGCLKFLSITGTGIQAAGAGYIAQALGANTLLEELYLGWEDYLDPQGLEILLSPFFHHSNSDEDPLAALPLALPSSFSNHGSGSGSGSRCGVGSASRSSRVSSSSASNLSTRNLNYNIRWLHFTARECRSSSISGPLDSGGGFGEVVAQMLRSNTSLSMMGLNYSSFSATEWQAILKSLEDNTTLETLSLCDCETFSGEAVYTSLMELLQVNTSIKKIDLRNTPLEREGKLPAVEQQLRRNADEFVPLLKEMPQVRPKSARLFLCGFPYAGKTTLRKSMLRSLRVSGKASCAQGVAYNSLELMLRLHTCLNGRGPKQRTRGMEIHVLKDDLDMRISMWDLAGQEEFHALHDYMFPDTNNACIFLFVFSCMDVETGRMKSVNDLETEFSYWLCFIASNTRRPATVLPLVLVVLSNLDKVGGSTADLVAWATEMVDHLRHRFDKTVDISPHIHAVNARSFGSVQPLVEFLLDRFRDLLTRKLPWVPEACDQMRLVLASWTAKNRAQPTMRFSDFNSLSARNLQTLKSMGRRMPKPVRDTIEARRRAVASYLHNVGEIIYFDNLDFIVVNPHWFGHRVLGRLINLVSFQRMHLDVNGFTSLKTLQRILHRSLSRGSGRKLVGINTDDLVQLMLKLELCYEKEPGNPSAGLFLPTCLDDQGKRALDGRRQLSWPMKDSSRECIYLGRRLECGDAFRTFLTPGFFPRFQVILYNEFLRMGMSQDYTLERNLISICIDGMEILVECSGDIGYYVDVLVRSSKSHIETMDFVHCNVMEKIRSFCASHKGCQGVALVEGILRPDCVRNLTLCVHRKDQAVRVEALKEEWRRSSAKLDHMYTWPRAPDGNLPSSCDSVVALLGARDVKNYLDRQYYDIEEVAEKLRTVTMSLEEADEGAWKSKYLDQKFPRDHAYSPREAGDGIDIMLSRMDDMEERLMKPLSRIENSMEELKNGILAALKPQMEKIHTLQEETIRELSNKMDRLMDFSTEMEQRKMPRLVYFTTNDVSRTQRLLAIVRPGRVVPVRLHLMCEHRGVAPHGIPNQEGCVLVWEDETARKLRPILINGLKLLYMLVKVGAHVAAGIGNAIPDFAGLDSALPLTAGALALESIMDDVRQDPASVQPRDSGLWLRDFLKDKNIREVFDLYKVRYRKGEPQLAWVCREHRDRGIREHTMIDME